LSQVPHTAYLVNWITLGLDDRYQRYFFSGFHSVSIVSFFLSASS
jgi:hypothetical protein